MQEGESGLGQQHYEADLAGIDMSLDPALAGLSGLGDAFAPSHQTNGIMDMIDGQTPSYDLSGFAEGDTPAAGNGDVSMPGSAALNGHTSEDGDGTGDIDDTDEDEDAEDDEDEEEGYDSDLAAMIEGEIGGASTSTNGVAGTLRMQGASLAQTAAVTLGTATSNAVAVSKEQAGDASDASGGSDEDGDSDDLFGKGRSDDDEDDVDLGDSTVKDTEETLEAKRRVRLMADEMRDLENAVSRKKQEVSRAPNPIIRRRFEDSLKKLSGEFELKKAQYAAAQSKLLHAQQEIKRAQLEEEDEEEEDGVESNEPTAPAAGHASGHAGDSAGLLGIKTDPVTVFGSSSSGNPGSANKPSVAFDVDDAMQVDAISPPPLGPLSTANASPGQKGEVEYSASASNPDDVQVKDFVPDHTVEDNDEAEDSDLFGEED